MTRALEPVNLLPFGRCQLAVPLHAECPVTRLMGHRVLDLPREVTLEPYAMLMRAMARQQVGERRVNWRLHRCADDPECVCRELLPA